MSFAVATARSKFIDLLTPKSLQYRSIVTCSLRGPTRIVLQCRVPSERFRHDEALTVIFKPFRCENTRDPSARQRRMFATKPDESKLRHTPSQIPEEPKPTLTKRLLSFTPHENIYTVPNILTLSRLLAAPLVGYLVIHDRHAWALGLFAYAGITDLADGWIARRWKQQTVVGTVIDPMADKMLMTILTGVLAWKGAMPIWCAGIILSRDILLAITAIYYRWISLPPPKTFSRYWDFSLPSAEVHPTGISKINTALQLGLIGWTVSMPVLQGTAWGPGLETALVGMQYLVATTTIWSGASYIYTKDAVKILSHEEREQKLNEKAVKDKDAPR